MINKLTLIYRVGTKIYSAQRSLVAEAELSYQSQNLSKGPQQQLARALSLATCLENTNINTNQNSFWLRISKEKLEPPVNKTS